jgi:hypothetical protein
MKDAMSKLKKQAADLAARAAADAEEAAQFRAQAEQEYNSIAAELDVERQQVGVGARCAGRLLQQVMQSEWFWQQGVESGSRM